MATRGQSRSWKWENQFKLQLLELMIKNKQHWKTANRDHQNAFFEIVAREAMRELRPGKYVKSEDIKDKVHVVLCGPRRNTAFKTDPEDATEAMVDTWNAIVDPSREKKLERMDANFVNALVEGAFNAREKARDTLLNPSSSPKQWQDAEIMLAAPLVMAARAENCGLLTKPQRNTVVSWTRSTARTALFDLIADRRGRPMQRRAPQTARGQAVRGQAVRGRPSPGQVVQQTSEINIVIPKAQVNVIAPNGGPPVSPESRRSVPNLPVSQMPKNAVVIPKAQAEVTDLTSPPASPEARRSVPNDNFDRQYATQTSPPKIRLPSEQQQQNKPHINSSGDSSTNSNPACCRQDLESNVTIKKELISSPATFVRAAPLLTKRKAADPLDVYKAKKLKPWGMTDSSKAALEKVFPMGITSEEALASNMALGAHKNVGGHLKRATGNLHQGGNNQKGKKGEDNKKDKKDKKKKKSKHQKKDVR